jgi:Ets-domain
VLMSLFSGSQTLLSFIVKKLNDPVYSNVIVWTEGLQFRVLNKNRLAELLSIERNKSSVTYDTVCKNISCITSIKEELRRNLDKPCCTDLP